MNTSSIIFLLCGVFLLFMFFSVVNEFVISFVAGDTVIFETASLDSELKRRRLLNLRNETGKNEGDTALATLLLDAEVRGIYSSSTQILDIADVPFVPQSPLGEWGNPIFQNACEETSILMAYYWAVGRPLTKEIAHEEILRIAQYEKNLFGFHEDTSISDTALILSAYFVFNGAETYEGYAATGEMVTDIILEHIAQGRLVIIPVAGQKLENPHFGERGPIVHMLVVHGYDFRTNEFITHEPGTQFGKDYRYSSRTIEEAIGDYATGDSHSLQEGSWSMIVVDHHNETPRLE